MGVGRPNLDVPPDVSPATGHTFNLHMAIEDLTPDEASEVQTLIGRSIVEDDRRPLKDYLRDLMRARVRTNYKSGHKLIDALNDKPSDDDEPE